MKKYILYRHTNPTITSLSHIHVQRPCPLIFVALLSCLILPEQTTADRKEFYGLVVLQQSLTFVFANSLMQIIAYMA